MNDSRVSFSVKKLRAILDGYDCIFDVDKNDKMTKILKVRSTVQEKTVDRK